MVNNTNLIYILLYFALFSSYGGLLVKFLLSTRHAGEVPLFGTLVQGESLNSRT